MRSFLPQHHRALPILVLLTSHWVSLLGVALVTTAGFSWLFVLPTELRGRTSNPYIGIVVFLVIPIIFILGLVLIALGMFLARRRIIRAEQDLFTAGDRRAYIRKLAIFFAVTTAANIVIGTQGTYRAVEHMETATVLRAELSRHETRIYRPSELAPRESGVRGLPRRSWCGRLAGKQERRYPAVH